MTINKAQGQSYDKVGIYLPSPVFSYGQLYVALSRVRKREKLKILLENNVSIETKDKKQKTTVCTKNIVYQEVL